MTDPGEDRTVIRLLRTVVAVGVVSAVTGTLWLFMQGQGDLWWFRFGIHHSLIPVVLSFFIWRIIPRQPRNPVVWTLVALSGGGLYVAGLAVVASMIEGDLVARLPPQLNPSSLPPQAAWVMVATFPAVAAVFPLMTLGLLLFPDGRLPSPRWRGIAWLAVVVIGVGAVADAWSYRPTSSLSESPIDDAAEIAFIPVAMLCLVAMIMRFRRSSGAMRQQFKWIVWGASILVPVLVFSVVAAGTEVEVISRPLVLVAGFLMVGSYVVAVARYRLYDVDLVINRTVVFVGLAGFITLVYALLVVGVGQLVGGREGLILPILATALVAVAFEPVRRRAQTWANRLVYGRRATPYEVLSDMTERLAAAGPGEEILGQMARLLVEGSGADRATVWLGPEGDMKPVVTWPIGPREGDDVDLDVEEVFPVTHDDEIVGALELAAPPGGALSARDVSLVSDLAGSAGLVLGYRRLNDSLAERAHEVNESRARLVRAEEEERRRLEDDLRGGVHHSILELMERSAAAADLAKEHHADDLAALLDGVAAEARTASDEVQSLAKGIYPSVLVSEGLAAAVSSLAEGAPVEVAVSHDGVTRYPSRVEAAVYFNVAEAMTNAVKHARPPIHIDLAGHDNVLRFSVSDRGPGFDVDAVERGSGLENMRVRLDAVGGRIHIDSAPGARTEVCGEIQLVAGIRKATVGA